MSEGIGPARDGQRRHDPGVGSGRIAAGIHVNHGGATIGTNAYRDCARIAVGEPPAPHQVGRCPHASRPALHACRSRIVLKIHEARQSCRREYAQYHDHDDQFDQGKTTIALKHSFLHYRLETLYDEKTTARIFSCMFAGAQSITAANGTTGTIETTPVAPGRLVKH